ncbi:four-carbon acid sugar kinase family protein [Curtobacterium sp. MCPF17_052]|nr:four-carbon acid sugar kinase family protein [Curtobacterium sp. MCPF17_052]WIB13929.1 four-carbon acid sugar kinase family protein [Curtobacterium sp. MCPF17_052]
MSDAAATLTIVADDLTGAADAAAGYGAIRTSAVVLGPEVPWPAADVLAVDTESRYLSGQEAASLVGSVVRRSVDLGRPVFKKIDSLLRGNVGAEVAAALDAVSGPERALAVVAPAFPGTGRTTVGGVVHVGGAPNIDGDHAGDVAASLTAAGLQAGRLSPAPTDSPADIAAQLDRLHADGVDAVVLDAVTDADLETIARASRLVTGPVLVTGSGGLAAHMLSLADSGATPTAPLAPVDRVLVVVGSYSGPARSQIDELVRRGAEHVELRHRDDGEQAATDQIARSVSDVVLTPRPGRAGRQGQRPRRRRGPRGDRHPERRPLRGPRPDRRGDRPSRPGRARHRHRPRARHRRTRRRPQQPPRPPAGPRDEGGGRSATPAPSPAPSGPSDSRTQSSKEEQ